MNERDWADRFNRDVDRLLNETRRTDTKPLPTEYRQLLDLARILATTDFSTESRGRQSLRRRLLNQIDAQEGWHRRKEELMGTLFWQRRPTLTFIALTLATLLALMLAWPDALTAAAQGIHNVIQRIVVGRYTEARQVEFQIEGDPSPLPSDMWLVITDIGGFGGNVLPGQDSNVRMLTSFEEAQAAISFRLRAPGCLPPGYILREVKVAPDETTFLFYGGTGHDIILVQSAVGPQSSGDSRVAKSVVSQIVTNGTLEEVELNGRPAVWVDGQSLSWEADGIAYTLGGLDLSLEEAIRIAESLQ